VVAVGDAVWSCSQNGVVRRSREGADELVLRPQFRCLALAVIEPRAAGDADAPPRLLLGGGVPGGSGMLAVMSVQGNLLCDARAGDDLVYAVAIAPGGMRGAAALATGEVITFGLPDLDERRVIHRHTAAARGVAFASGGPQIVMAGWPTSPPRCSRTWESKRRPR
jgi:hypothetical protein